jgi:hypothetical protein
VCEILLGSSASHNPLICNIKDSEDMRKERKRKTGAGHSNFREGMDGGSDKLFAH